MYPIDKQTVGPALLGQSLLHCNRAALDSVQPLVLLAGEIAVLVNRVADAAQLAAIVRLPRLARRKARQLEKESPSYYCQIGSYRSKNSSLVHTLKKQVAGAAVLLSISPFLRLHLCLSFQCSFPVLLSSMICFSCCHVPLAAAHLLHTHGAAGP